MRALLSTPRRERCRLRATTSSGSCAPGVLRFSHAESRFQRPARYGEAIMPCARGPPSQQWIKFRSMFRRPGSAPRFRRLSASAMAAASDTPRAVGTTWSVGSRLAMVIVNCRARSWAPHQTGTNEYPAHLVPKHVKLTLIRKPFGDYLSTSGGERILLNRDFFLYHGRA